MFALVMPDFRLFYVKNLRVVRCFKLQYYQGTLFGAKDALDFANTIPSSKASQTANREAGSDGFSVRPQVLNAPDVTDSSASMSSPRS